MMTIGRKTIGMTYPNKLDTISDDDLLRLKESMSYAKMAHTLRTSETRIYNEFKKRGILDKKHNKLEGMKDDELIKLRNDRYTYCEIGKLYDISANTVRAEFAKRNLDVERRVSKCVLADMADSELQDLRNKCRSLDSMAQSLSVSKTTLHRELTKRKLSKQSSITDRILELRSYGITNEKIAEVLDISINTVYYNTRDN